MHQMLHIFKIKCEDFNQLYNTYNCLQIQFKFDQYLFVIYKASNFGGMKPKGVKKLTYDQRVIKCEEFLKNYQDYDIGEIGPAYEHYGRKKYLIDIQKIANGETKILEIFYEDLESFFRKQDEKELVNDFRTNTLRNVKVFTEIVHKIMPARNIPVATDEEIKSKFQNLLNLQRLHNISQQEGQHMSDAEQLPNLVLQNFQVYIVYGPSSKIHFASISELTSEKIGSLVVCKCIVIRSSDIRPELSVATYACDVCGYENYQEIVDKQYKPLVRCMSKRCAENHVNGKLTFLPGHSIFRQYQELKVQETPDQLTAGKIPKSFIIHIKGENCKQAAPGDVVMIQGVLLPIKRDNGKDTQSLSFTTYLEACKITREKKKYVQMNVNQEQISKINSVRSNYTDEDIFKKMARSIAPEIFGLETVKKALLLLMVGGVTKITEDNLRIRGEINIALIGDPGIAKSQLLKHIAQIAPRGVYTTGKGSSGVGLTAAITIDPQTREVFLEAGALVLADMGVCCIDQFDKMSQYDRTAIHQVMEQQTVSIAKAGVTTSLNARASILAAANPLYGRYNRRESAHKNINLPAALLSRFDLIFILLDQANALSDKQLAVHIGKVHQNMKSPEQENLFDPTFLRHFIAISKSYEPIINEDLHKQMIERYIEKRKEQMDISKQGQNYTTMRSLLALIRLSQARARLRFSNEVSKSDIFDCLEIIEESQKYSSEARDGKVIPTDISGNIFALIKTICLGDSQMSGDLVTIEKRVMARGFSLEDLQKTLNDYEKLNVLMVNNGKVTLLD